MPYYEVELQDEIGNVFHPHTSAEVVFMEDGTVHNISPTAHPGMMRNLGAITSGNIKDKILELASSGTFDVSPDVTGTPDAKYYQGEVFYVGAGRIHVQLTSLNTVEHQTYKAMYIDGMWTDWALVYDAQSMSVAAAAPTTTLADDMIVMVPR